MVSDQKQGEQKSQIITWKKCLQKAVCPDSPEIKVTFWWAVE